MESPRRYLERRCDEVDRDLMRSLEHLCRHDATVGFVQEHPFAALGAGAATGFLAARLLRGRRGLAFARRLLAASGRFAMTAAALRKTAPTPTPDPPESSSVA